MPRCLTGLPRGSILRHHPGTVHAERAGITRVVSCRREPATWRFSLDDGTVLDCAVQPAENTWYSAVQAGCPQASIVLGRRLALANLAKVYDTWGFDETPVIPVAAARPSKLEVIDNLVDASAGSG